MLKFDPKKRANYKKLLKMLDDPKCQSELENYKRSEEISILNLQENKESNSFDLLDYL